MKGSMIPPISLSNKHILIYYNMSYKTHFGKLEREHSN